MLETFDGGEILGHVITRRALAADGSRDNHEIADLHVILQRAATADANQRFRSGGTKNLRRHRRVGRKTPPIADRDALPIDGSGMHLVVEKGKVLCRILQHTKQHLAALFGAGNQRVGPERVGLEPEHRQHFFRCEVRFLNHGLEGLNNELK